MSERVAFITGVTGQDGACLAELLLGKGYEWHGSGRDEKGLEAGSGRPLVEIDPRYFRPTEVDFLCGDPSKARAKLGWNHKVSFAALVSEMVESDLATVGRESARRNRHD